MGRNIYAEHSSLQRESESSRMALGLARGQLASACTDFDWLSAEAHGETISKLARHLHAIKWRLETLNTIIDLLESIEKNVERING